MRRHTLIGERIVQSAPALVGVSGLIRSSHERWDGTGYPDQLAGDDIPLGSQIVFVCDAYAAMTSTRSYQSAMSHAAALAELRDNAGTPVRTRRRRRRARRVRRARRRRGVDRVAGTRRRPRSSRRPGAVDARTSSALSAYTWSGRMARRSTLYFCRLTCTLTV